MKERVYCDACTHYHDKEEYGADNYCDATAYYTDPLPQAFRNPVYTPKRRYIGTANPCERNSNNECPLYSSSVAHKFVFIAVVLSIVALIYSAQTIFEFVNGLF